MKNGKANGTPANKAATKTPALTTTLGVLIMRPKAQMQAHIGVQWHSE